MKDINKPNITAIILTYNEEKHLARCIESIKVLVNEILVVDSYSTDATLSIAESYGAKIVQNPFINQAIQFQWAIDNCVTTGEWILKMDADEYVDANLVLHMPRLLAKVNDGVSGVYLKRKVFFLDQWMRYGGSYPQVLLRLFRKGHAYVEQRWMDEHLVLSQGRGVLFEQGHLIDHNLNDLTWWTQKHNQYATREMADLMTLKYQLLPSRDAFAEDQNKQAKLKRWLKEALYAKLPIGLRPVLFFIYRYLLRFGFLDGFRGFAWHALQGFWYRLLVDVKCYEFEVKLKHYESPKALLEKEYGIKL
jgi:glycosyltransferase involved in cell wall biosynthesis